MEEVKTNKSISFLISVAIALAGLVLPGGAFQTVRLLVYLLVGVNSILAIAIGVSWVSPAASLILTETISCVVCSPFTLLIGIKSEVLHLVPGRAHDAQAQLTCPPAWLKQVLLLFLIDGRFSRLFTWLPCLLLGHILVYVVGAIFEEPEDDKNENIEAQPIPSSSYNVVCKNTLKTIVILLVLAALSPFMLIDLFSFWACLIYCLLTCKTCHSLVTNFVVKPFSDHVEGMEQTVTTGMYVTVELIIAVTTVLINLYAMHPLVPLSSIVNVMYPVGQLYNDVIRPIQKEQQVLNGFRRASRRLLLQYDDVCAICLVKMTSARVTPCSHLFHGKCLRRSLLKKGTCPICNQNFKTANNYHQRGRF